MTRLRTKAVAIAGDRYPVGPVYLSTLDDFVWHFRTGFKQVSFTIAENAGSVYRTEGGRKFAFVVRVKNTHTEEDYYYYMGGYTDNIYDLERQFDSILIAQDQITERL